MEPSENSTEKHTHTATKNKKQQNIHPRRFSDEQIKSLESIFKNETKLEPRKKVQIARDLCLQPRQVAIWFQNKRARWKSKQIEHQLTHLKSNYDALSTKFDDLKRENHSLQMQLQELNDRLNDRDGDDDHMINDERIITSCYGKTEEEDQFIRWSGEEEMASQTWCNFFDESSENTKWWES